MKTFEISGETHGLFHSLEIWIVSTSGEKDKDLKRGQGFCHRGIHSCWINMQELGLFFIII